MRILQVGPVPPEVGGTTMGGVATHAWELSTHLAKRGHEVAILADNFPAASQAPVTVDGVKIYGVCLSKLFVLKQLPSILLNLPTLFRLKRHFEGSLSIPAIIWSFCRYSNVLRHFRPDIVHVHHLEQRFPFAHYAARGRIPIVTTVHSTSIVKSTSGVQREKNLRLIRRNASLAKHIVFGFPTRTREFLSLLDEEEREKIRCWLVPYPMNASMYYPLPKAEARSQLNMTSQKPLVLFVANLVPLKGASTLVEAASLLQERDGELGFCVAIVGSGPQEEELATMVTERRLESHVSILGAKTYPDLLYYYNAADLFVLPSEEEALPTTAFEAMQCGCPILVSTRVAPEMLPPPEIAQQVPTNDEKALAKAIQECLKRNWNRDRIAEYVRAYDWEVGKLANVSKFESMYSSLVEWRATGTGRTALTFTTGR